MLQIKWRSGWSIVWRREYVAAALIDSPSESVILLYNLSYNDNKDPFQMLMLCGKGEQFNASKAITHKM